MFTLAETNNKKFAVDSIDSTMHELSNALIGESVNKKNVAILCNKLKNDGSFKSAFGETKFTAVIDKYYGSVLSGSTAYKYAQVAETFGEKDFFEKLLIGKLVILLNTESKNAKKHGASAEKFFWYIGDTLNEIDRKNLERWEEENKDTLEAVKALKKSGFDMQAEQLEKALATPPQSPITVDNFITNAEDKAIPEVLEEAEKALNEYLYNNGISVYSSCSDKDSKQFVKMYLESIGIAGKEKKVDTETLKEKAITAILAYVEAAFDGVLTSTLAEALESLGFDISTLAE